MPTDHPIGKPGAGPAWSLTCSVWIGTESVVGDPREAPVHQPFQAALSAAGAVVMRCLPLSVTLMLAVVVAAPLDAQEGQTYLVNITQEDQGGPLQGCLTFSGAAPGTWTVEIPDAKPFSGVWAHGKLNKSKKFWQAVLIDKKDVIAFHGKVTGGGRKIKGDFIDASDGSTGTFKGKNDPDCASKL